MSDTVYGLVGVVIGALLGGIAQAVGSWLQDIRKHRQWERERRLGVYQGFLDSWARFQRQLDATVPVEADLQVAATDFVVNLKRIQLNGSAATFKAADLFYAGSLAPSLKAHHDKAFRANRQRLLNNFVASATADTVLPPSLFARVARLLRRVSRKPSTTSTSQPTTD